MSYHHLTKKQEKELIKLRACGDGGWPVERINDKCRLAPADEQALACVNLILGASTIGALERAAEASRVKKIEFRNQEYYNTLPKFWQRDGRR